jgi:GntR family transcriptional regulator
VGLFPIEFKAGVPVYEQVLYAARKAIISGDLKPGDPFPSVRTLSAEYGINPNTVQKAIMVLKNEGLVETVPGVGNRIAERPEFKAGERTRMLAADLEALVIRARQLHLREDELVAAIHSHWNKL